MGSALMFIGKQEKLSQMYLPIRLCLNDQGFGYSFRGGVGGASPLFSFLIFFLKGVQLL